MMKHRKIYAITAWAVLTSATGYAQDIILWRASNPLSPTVVPAYAGQLSPFPVVAEKAQDISQTITPEALQALQQRDEALKKAQHALEGKGAFHPDIGVLQIEGIVEGQAGPKVLISNQWIGLGRKINVKLSRSPLLNQAVSNLRQFDEAAAADFESQVMSKLNKNPYVELVLSAITRKQITFSSSYGEFVIPVQDTSKQL